MRFIVLLLLFGKLPAAAEDAGLRASLEAHRWFDLRDAVTSREAPPLFRFFVSAAFNDARGAERDLKAVVRSGATRKQLTDAHYALKHLYYRNGQYRKASAEMRRVVELASDWVPSEAEKANMEAVGRLPDLEVVSRRPATITTT
ncbi:MAG: hypothetical protein NTW28_12625, partial [Candidatus Solibacter sp.]|nr:hypothetical protein [Candidatus Solibacter sp.]